MIQPLFLDPERGEFLPLTNLASAREKAYLEVRGLERCDLLPSTTEHIDLARATRCVAMAQAKDMGRALVHLELSRLAGGLRKIYYQKAIPLKAQAPLLLLGVPRRRMAPEVDGLGRLCAINASLQSQGQHYKSACLDGLWFDIDMVASHMALLAEFARKIGRLADLPRIETLLKDVAGFRKRVADHYGVSVEQTKILLIRLTYRGSLRRWRSEVGTVVANDLQELLEFSNEILRVVGWMLSSPHLNYVLEAAHWEWNRRREGPELHQGSSWERDSFAASYMLQEMEDAELSRLEHWVHYLGWECGGLFFDGLCARPSRRSEKASPDRPANAPALVAALNARLEETGSVVRVALRPWAKVSGMQSFSPEPVLPCAASESCVLPPDHPHLAAAETLLARHLADVSSKYTHSFVGEGPTPVHQYRACGSRRCIFGIVHCEGDFLLEVRGFDVMYKCFEPGCKHAPSQKLGQLPPHITLMQLSTAGLNLAEFDILAPSRVVSAMKDKTSEESGQAAAAKACRTWFREYLALFFFSVAHPARTVAEVVYSDNTCSRMLEYHVHLEVDFKALLQKVETGALSFLLQDSPYKSLFGMWQGEVAARNMVHSVKVVPGSREVLCGDPQKPGRRVLNSFTCFPFVFDRGFLVDMAEISPILDHIREVWCNRSASAYHYVLRWFAHMLQFPERKDSIGTALLIRGAPG